MPVFGCEYDHNFWEKKLKTKSALLVVAVDVLPSTSEHRRQRRDAEIGHRKH